MSRFRNAVDSLIRVEGGYSNHSWDNGGATKYGVTAKTLGMFRGYDAPASAAEVKALDLISARAVYQKYIWLPMHLEEFEWPMAYVIFDAATNHGNRGATKLMQRAFGITQDGVLGPITLGKMKSSDPNGFTREFQTLRIAKYMSLKDFDKAGHGWMNRIVDTLFISWVQPLPPLPDNSIEDPD